MANLTADFYEAPLSEQALEKAPEWDDFMTAEFLRIALATKLEEGDSLEERIKKAKGKVDKAQENLDAREAIEVVPKDDRTEDQKTALRKMVFSSRVYREVLESAKRDLRDVETKMAEMWKKVGEITSIVRKSVSSSLFRVYREKQEEHRDNSHKQAIEGLKAIKDRLRVEPELRLADMRDKITDYTQGYTVAVQTSNVKLVAIDKLVKDTEKFQNFLGLKSGALTAAEAITAVRRGIKHAYHGVQNVSMAMQDVINAGEGKKDWNAFYSELKGLMDAAEARNKVDEGKLIEDGNNGGGGAKSFMADGGRHQNTQEFRDAVAREVSDQLKTLQGGGGAAFHANAAAAAGGQHGVATTIVPSSWIAATNNNASNLQYPSSFVFNAGTVDMRGQCYDFQKNKCRRGDSCKFAHSIKGGGSSKVALRETAEDRSKKNCRDGALCKRPGCGFLHPNGKMDIPGTPDPKKKRA